MYSIFIYPDQVWILEPALVHKEEPNDVPGKIVVVRGVCMCVS